ncbi:MAG: PH domain-containing protein [Actinobacteria bacterium]|uniref:Unannotated protein n=1 Tax=freshwater metagenome TaxID=449393 RepID=A0A6J6FWF9_9ZZZZ|nr:PH domain-containing protein [Actinomycetota bacterium]
MTTFVSRSGRVLSVVTVAVFGLAVGTTLFPFTADGFIRSVAVFGFLTVAVYAAFWRPRLDVTDEGVVVTNVFATHTVDWGAVHLIDTKWGLTLWVTGRRISVWAAPAPGRYTTFTASRDLGEHLPESTYLAGTVRPGDLASTESGGAAAVVRRQWERRSPDDGRVVTTYSVGIAVALGVTGLCAALALFTT